MPSKGTKQIRLGRVVRFLEELEVKREVLSKKAMIAKGEARRDFTNRLYQMDIVIQMMKDDFVIGEEKKGV